MGLWKTHQIGHVFFSTNKDVPQGQLDLLMTCREGKTGRMKSWSFVKGHRTTVFLWSCCLQSSALTGTHSTGKMNHYNDNPYITPPYPDATVTSFGISVHTHLRQIPYFWHYFCTVAQDQRLMNKGGFYKPHGLQRPNVC